MSISKRNLHFILIAITGIIAYSNSFTIPFVFDDSLDIVDNAIIRNIGNFISSVKGYAYNPRRFVGYFSFALNYHFGGLDVVGYHVVNLLIHITNGFLVYIFVSLTFRTPYFRLSRDDNWGTGKTVALFSSLLFVAHPLQTEAVTYIVQRFTSLAAFFYLSALVFYIKGRLTDQGDTSTGAGPYNSRRMHISLRWIFYIFSLIFAVLAMKTKEIAFTLPLVALVYEFSFFRSPLRKRLLVLVPLVITLAIIPLSMMNVHRPLGELLSDISEKTRVQTSLPRADYLLTETRVITTYIRLLFFPFNQSLDYNYPVYHSISDPPVLFSCIFLLSLVGLCSYLFCTSRPDNTTADRPENQRKLLPPPFSRLAAFGIAWFFITLSVESSFIPIVDVIYEHRVYLPSIGFFLLLGICIARLKNKLGVWIPPWSKYVTLAMAVIIAALSLVTYSRNLLWNNPVGLWEDVVQKNPGSFRGHYNLGTLESKEGHLAKAMRQLQIAVSLNPGSDEAHDNLGMVYGRLGLTEEAIAELKTAIKLNPGDIHAHENLRKIYDDQGRYENAGGELYYTYAIRHYEKGGDLYRQGNLEQAKAELRKAVGLRPDYPEAHNAIGIILDREGRVSEAITEFRRAVDLKPDYAVAHNNLGMAYVKDGHLDEAIKELETAVSLNPDYLVAIRNLQNVRVFIGKVQRHRDKHR